MSRAADFGITDGEKLILSDLRLSFLDGFALLKFKYTDAKKIVKFPS